jgi:hypothetical protein
VPLAIEVARWLAAASTLLAVLKLGGSLFQEERTSSLHHMNGHDPVRSGSKTMADRHLRAAARRSW